jgi:hypothetical protein
MASYRVDVSGDARIEIRRSPGNIRQRIIRGLRLLEAEPRPAGSRPLDPERAGVDLAPGAELRRIRLESWRIV